MTSPHALASAALSSARDRAANPEAALFITGDRWNVSQLAVLQSANQLSRQLGEYAPAAERLIDGYNHMTAHHPELLRVDHPWNVPTATVEYVAPPGVRLFVLWPLPELTPEEQARIDRLLSYTGAY
jgi:hypothetical protein